MSETQARRFVNKLNYDIDFLLHGWGELYPKDMDDWFEELMKGITLAPKDLIETLKPHQLSQLIDAACQIIDASICPDLIDAWRALLSLDQNKFLSSAKSIQQRLESVNAPVYFSAMPGLFFILECKKERPDMDSNI